MDPPPAEGNFFDNSNRLMQPHIMERYNQHMRYVDNSDHMANSFSMSRCTFKWKTKLFFHLPDLTVLNSWILLPSCGAKYTHRDFRLFLVRNLIAEAGQSQDHPTPRLVGRPSVAATNVVWLKNRHNQHWSAKSSTKLCCRLCSFHGQRKGTCIHVPNVVCACVWCLVSWNITPQYICKSPLSWILCVVIKQWSKVPQTFCSNQNYVSNKLFTPHFI